MAYNPFLSMNEPSAPVTTDVLNPFMIADTEPDAVTSENPFATSNPFSDFGSGYEPPAGDTVPVDIFSGIEPAGIGAKQYEEFSEKKSTPLDIFTSSPVDQDRLVKPTELDLVVATDDHPFSNEEEDQSHHLPARPLPPETQNLILTVTGQMEFTSSHLLDRIPPTRTPSPVSVRDIHSPSPTPEPEHFEEPISDNFDINRNKPTRPPPARPPPATRPPPPRPQPPRPPTATPLTQPVAPPPTQHSDDINLFDAPMPTTIKPTKEAILSLYTAPKKEEKPIDFLSDDLLDDVSTDVKHDISQHLAGEVATSVGALSGQTSFEPEELKSASVTISNVFSSTIDSKADTVAPMDCSEPQIEEASATCNTSPFGDALKDDFSAQSASIDVERNPFENTIDSVDVVAQLPEAVDIFGVKSDDVVMTSSNEVFNNAKENIFEISSISGTGEIPSDPFHSATNETNVMALNPSEALDRQAESAFDVSGMSPSATADWGAPTEVTMQDVFPSSQDAFDAFSAKFDATAANNLNTGAWGDDSSAEAAPSGFEAEAFDPFLSMGAPPPPAATPRLDHQASRDSVDDTFSVFIRPKDSEAGGEEGAVPVLAPPPRPQALPESPRANPFDKSGFEERRDPVFERGEGDAGSEGEGEGPPTPLFDEDVSQPLEDFPRTKYTGPGWEMHLRQPNKKKITGQRFWKKIFVRVALVGDNPVVQLYNSAADKEPFQELPLQACYSVSDIGAQQFDQFGKIFTVKLQYVFYKERPGVRPGQVTKAERITNKLSQFAAYAIQGDYQGVKEFGSDLRKLGLPVEHAPQLRDLRLTRVALAAFFHTTSAVITDVVVGASNVCRVVGVAAVQAGVAGVRGRQAVQLLRGGGAVPPRRAPRPRPHLQDGGGTQPSPSDTGPTSTAVLTACALQVQITAVDELYVEQDAEGSVLKQIARVRLFFLGFLSGMPDVELGVNDLRRQGKEVVGRHDIIPVVTEEWIRVEDAEFHACVQPEEFANTQIIKFKPPDACYIELMRFRVRPPKNRELPLQLKAVWCVTGNKVRPTPPTLPTLGMSKVELRADVLVPGFASRKLGQVPCEDVAVRFPIPDCWIYLFRVEKHFRYGSVKSAHRRTGKIKGIERFLGAVDTLQESLIEVTSGQAKYEHQHRAIVWRMPRLPKEGQGAYTTHNLVCRMALTSYDQVPAELASHAFVEFTMPATQVSHMTVRSVSLQDHDGDPPEKYVRYLARHEYIVGIERTSGQAAPAYALATAGRHADAAPPPPPAAAPLPQPPSSDSDSD
ncbi:hypothetical protein HF086_016295 [Spodoptera exigua]|uniref:Protein stoned-B n=1 Tax=Spodoptera exigua TaxID=7107 RepID=A0A922MAA9_SPOEX|nr:hypothetical protein HF086_016295 [Spodoptera exigua]